LNFRRRAQYRSAMRRILIAVLFFTSLAAFAADAVTGKVVKVLPLFLDTQGRVAQSPSLFDRDAYQIYLRAHTNEISGIRYDVQWQASQSAGEKLKLRVELRGVGSASLPESKTLEAEVAPGKSSGWTELKFTGDDFKKSGTVVAWRATLWNGSQQLGEQKSFLW
jgi:hypothetical protein